MLRGISRHKNILTVDIAHIHGQVELTETKITHVHRCGEYMRGVGVFAVAYLSIGTSFISFGEVAAANKRREVP